MDAPQSRREQVKAALPGTAPEVMAKTGLARTTVWRHLKDLLEAEEIHITKDWKRTEGGGPFVPTYAAGKGENAPCKLKPYTEAQKSKRHRSKTRKDGRWALRLVALRDRWAANHRTYTRDPLLAALFKSKTTNKGQQQNDQSQSKNQAPRLQRTASKARNARIALLRSVRA